MTQKSGETRLHKNSIGLAHIVFFVVAAAAPMTAVVGATPPAFAFGNGVGVPGAFILAGVLYLLFSVGFTAMTRHVKGAGGFYSYVSLGLGRPAGIGGALLALTAYFAIQLAIYALFGVFAAATAARLGLDLPWWVLALAVMLVVTLCGRRNIAISGRILGVCMIAELLILLALDIAIVLHGGSAAEGLSLAGFRPSEVLAPGLGVAMVFVLCSYVGFEATAIFGEEAVEPDRTIPLATYVAVLLITLFYAVSTWAIVQYYGPSNLQAAAAADMEGFYFTAAADLLGGWSVEAMNILLLTSLFAGLLSFHNTLNRYFYTLGREGLAWSGLCRIHDTHGSPHVAGMAQTVLVTGLLLAFGLGGADPYAMVFSWMSGLAILCLIAVQIMVSFGAIVFFRKIDHGRSAFTTLVAPALATLGLAGSFILISSNLSLLTGSENSLVLSFPIIVIGLAGLGVGLALWLRQSRPDRYARLGHAFE